MPGSKVWSLLKLIQTIIPATFLQLLKRPNLLSLVNSRQQKNRLRVFSLDTEIPLFQVDFHFCEIIYHNLEQWKCLIRNQLGNAVESLYHWNVWSIAPSFHRSSALQMLLHFISVFFSHDPYDSREKWSNGLFYVLHLQLCYWLAD